MKQLWILLIGLLACASGYAATDTPDTLVVARDGSGKFRTIWEALEDCRAFMDYHKVIFVKKGTYKEKVIVPSWLTNIEILGEDRDETIITYDDHANIRLTRHGVPMGTFRTYTVKVEGNDITFKNIKHLEFKIIFFAIHFIHSKQHIRPVLSFSSTSPSMNVHNSVVRIIFPRKQS